MDVTFSSVAVLPNGTNMHPYVLLNVSVSVYNPASLVFIRLECLEAPNLEDDYCHNHREQYRRWGRMIWPCRALTVFESDLVSYPYFLNYHCFRLSAYSHYRMNISIAPNPCRKTYIVTIPEETHLYPAISRFYDANSKIDINHWLPLVSVDLTLQDSVVVRYERQPNFALPRISVAFFETTASSIIHLFTDTIVAPAVEYRWKNVPSGNYTACLYVSHTKCELMCDTVHNNDEKCVLCPSTRIHFTVQEDKIWSLMRSTYYAVPIFGVVISCFVVPVAVCSIFLYLWRCRRSKLREVSLSERTTVFITYTDDCELHSACIATLAEMLQHDANADVFFDQFELKSSEIIPARWFFDKLTTAHHVLLVFSEGARAVLKGENLIQRQPYPEFFQTAVNFTVSECNKEITKRFRRYEMSSRFAFAYMTYSLSSVIPVELRSLPVNIYRLPDQVGKLILWLHNQSSYSDVDIHADFSRLENAVHEVVQYQQSNPRWLADRLEAKQENTQSVFEPQNIPFQACRSDLTLEEQIRVAKALNLEPPDIQISLMDKVGKQQKARTKRMERRHACPNCDARFPFPNKLRLHIKSHHSLTNACDICSERFNRFNELRTHMRHAHQIIHQCHICAYSSSVKAEVRKHIVKNHENGVRCTVDGCTATVAYNRLRRHIRETHSHTDQRRVSVSLSADHGASCYPQNNRKCLVRGVADMKITSAAVEESAVTEEEEETLLNSHSTTVVSRNEDVSNNLSFGETISNDDGNNSKVEIGKADGLRSEYLEEFIDASEQVQDSLEMKNQMAVKQAQFYMCAEESEYVCQKCRKVFSSINRARRHYNRVHIKISEKRKRLKKYSCNFSSCVHQFSCPSKLRDHIASAHGDEASFCCDTCNRNFRSRSQFAVHLRRYHMVSIRDIPHGFMRENSTNACSVSNKEITKGTEKGAESVIEDSTNEKCNISMDVFMSKEVVPTVA